MYSELSTIARFNSMVLNNYDTLFNNGYASVIQYHSLLKQALECDVIDYDYYAYKLGL